jgi:serine/threonine-protein kinase
MSDVSAQCLGQYQIVTRIGRGSTLTIYKADQPKLGRFVAVKILSPFVADEDGFRGRWMQEAHAIARLDHLPQCAGV